MSNTFASRIVHDEGSEIVFHVTIIGDGSGELTSQLATVSTGLCGTSNTIKSVQACLSGFSLGLYFDASTDILACQIPSDSYVELDFMHVGIYNNAGSGKTGDINITTSGLGNGDSGFLLIRVILND